LFPSAPLPHEIIFIEEYTMKTRTLLALACTTGATLSPFSPLHAQDTEVREIVITSSRIATPLRQIGTSVSVLDAEMIVNRGNAALIDLLRSMPSVSVGNSGGAGQISNLRIRGEEGYRTLTLLDGMKLSDPSVTQVQPQLEHLLSSGIERIEILRGPQGLHYGADAGGVINISTRQHNSHLRAHVDLMSGAFATRQLTGNLSGGNDSGDFFVSATDFSTEGFNTRKADAVLRDRDGYDNTSLHGRFGLNASEALRLEVVLRDVKGDSAYDSCFHPDTFATIHDCDASFEQQAARVLAVFNSAWGSQTLAWGSTQTQRENVALGRSSHASKGVLERVEYIGSLTALQYVDLVFGTDLEEEDNNGEARAQLGIYAEALSKFSDILFLTVGVRRDDNEDFGRHTSARVSAAHLLDLRNGAMLKLRGSYGTGFRAPSPYEFTYNNGPFASAPAAGLQLTEETSRGHELALEYHGADDLLLEAVYFDQRIEDAIYFDLSAYSGYLQDIGESESTGLELFARLPLGEQWQMEANYTHNRTRLPDGGQRLRRPEQLANLGLQWHSRDERLKLSAFHRQSRDAVDALFGSPVELDDYQVLDLAARYTLMPGVEVYARLENAADEDYEEVLGYNVGGRAGHVGLRLNF
jgi:vitamin B12 transporter